MKKDLNNEYISSELLAAYLDGNTTVEESLKVLNSLASNTEIREIMSLSLSVDKELQLSEKVETIPMTALAAQCAESSNCCIECEKYILKKRGIIFDEAVLKQRAKEKKWTYENGTALYNVGRHLEDVELMVLREYNKNIKDISYALSKGYDVIVAIDGGELLAENPKEQYEDILFGERPDHAIVILSCDLNKDEITVYDPNSKNEYDIYTISQFIDAWNDSKNYLVTIKSVDMKNYEPKPIDLSDIELTDDLNDLREAIAENAHEIWAENRKKEGWTYGPQRNDELKQTPDMVPYSQLTEGEKEYDRQMAMKTIKLLKKLGYDLIKREDTELYKVLMERIKESKLEFRCPQCNTPIYRHQVYCDGCGHELKIDWSHYEI